jgi:hypothetical protein
MFQFVSWKDLQMMFHFTSFKDFKTSHLENVINKRGGCVEWVCIYMYINQTITYLHEHVGLFYKLQLLGLYDGNFESQFM